VKIAGKSVEGNDATVLVDVASHWTGEAGTQAWGMDTCSIFNSHEKETGAIQGKMRYKKYDTGWQLEGWE